MKDLTLRLLPILFVLATGAIAFTASEAGARTVRLPVSELRCIVTHSKAYVGADGEPLYIYPGSCPNVIEDLSQIDIPASNSTNVTIPLNGRIIGLTRKEIGCLISFYKRLDRPGLRPQAVIAVNISNCPRR